MFACKLGTPSCSSYEHLHVYLVYRRQTGTVVTRQTYDRAAPPNKSPTAHISRGGYVNIVAHRLYLWYILQHYYVLDGVSRI